MKKLVIFRGKPTSGKTTALRGLEKKRVMKNWIIIDSSKIKSKLGKKLGMHELLKEDMKSKKNILVDETSRKTLNKYLRYHIKKNNYKIIVFQFTVRIDTVYKRNIQRSEAKLEKYIKKKRIEELEKMHDERFDKNAFLIDTNKLGKTQVIKFILKKLGLK
jgi:tRNA uridine 5-carbamoylmethylation protein Kti12